MDSHPTHRPQKNEDQNATSTIVRDKILTRRAVKQESIIFLKGSSAAASSLVWYLRKAVEMETDRYITFSRCISLHNSLKTAETQIHFPLLRQSNRGNFSDLQIRNESLVVKSSYAFVHDHLYFTVGLFFLPSMSTALMKLYRNVLSKHGSLNGGEPSTDQRNIPF